MSSQHRVTTGSVFLACFALFALIAAISIRYIRPVNTLTSDPTLNSLTQQAADLRIYNDVELARSAELLANAQSRLWSPARIAAWTSDAHSRGWLVTPVDRNNGVFTVNQRYVLTRPDLAFKSWPDMLQFIAASSREPGFGIHSMTIEAPAGSKRAFTSINVLASLPQPRATEPVAN